MTRNQWLLVFGGIIILASGAYLMRPKGIRNNNPLNIKWFGDKDWENDPNKWVGMVGLDGEFVKFDKPENGFRAAARILKSYNRKGFFTISTIINRWAPEEDNNQPTTYIHYVAHQMGVDYPSMYIVDESDYPILLTSMAKFENGEFPYTLNTVIAGVLSA